MKKMFLLLVFGSLVIMGYSQTLKHTDILSKKNKNKQYSEYTASDGHTYKVGDKIKFGQPDNGKIFMFIRPASTSITYSLTVMTGIGNVWVDYTESGYEVEIRRIIVYGTKRTGYSVIFIVHGISLNREIHIEKALACGEIVGDGYSNDRALEELKKAKEKLDLELITRQQFDSIKAELSKYIK